MHWNIVFVEPLREKKNEIKNNELDITPRVQEYFSSTSDTTKSMNVNDGITIHHIYKNIGFYSMNHKKRLNLFKHERWYGRAHKSCRKTFWILC